MYESFIFIPYVVVVFKIYFSFYFISLFECECIFLVICAVFLKELNDEQEKTTKGHSMAIARCYPLKNRYPDVMPCKSRMCFILNADWMFFIVIFIIIMKF